MGTPLLVLLIACMTILALVRRWHGRGWHGLSNRDRVLLLLAGTATVLVVLTLKFGDVSLWYAIYKVVPGASALRAVGRMLIMVDVVVIILAVWGLQDWGGQGGVCGSERGQIMLAAGCALIIEQVNWSPFKLTKARTARFHEPLHGAR